MEGKFKSKNMDSLKILHPNNRDPAYVLPKIMHDNFILVINLMARKYF